MLYLGLEPDRLTYNALILAHVKTEKLDVAMSFHEQLKDKAQKFSYNDFHPDVYTYTTLLKGFGHARDLPSVLKLVFEMKSCADLFTDRTAFTVIIDALLIAARLRVCCSLCSLYIWRDSWFGHRKAYRYYYEMEWNILVKQGQHGGCADRSFVGIHQSVFSPYLLPQGSPDEPIESIMMPFEEARPLLGTTELRKVVMCFFRDPIVPVIDGWGSCVGLVHAEDCYEGIPYLFYATIYSALSRISSIFLTEKLTKMVV